MKSKEIVNGVKRAIGNVGEYYERLEKRAARQEERAAAEGKWWYFLGPGGGLRWSLVDERRKRKLPKKEK